MSHAAAQAYGRLGERATYPNLTEFVELALPSLTPTERDDIFGGTIGRLLGW